MRPFQQTAFSNLAPLPRQPHVYADTTPNNDTLETETFGRHEVHWRTYGSGPPLLLVLA